MRLCYIKLDLLIQSPEKWRAQVKRPPRPEFLITTHAHLRHISVAVIYEYHVNDLGVEFSYMSIYGHRQVLHGAEHKL
jgi:hypothetical protein